MARGGRREGDQNTDGTGNQRVVRLAGFWWMGQLKNNWEGEEGRRSSGFGIAVWDERVVRWGMWEVLGKAPREGVGTDVHVNPRRAGQRAKGGCGLAGVWSRSHGLTLARQFVRGGLLLPWPRGARP